jgi:hypothetical protein
MAPTFLGTFAPGTNINLSLHFKTPSEQEISRDDYNPAEEVTRERDTRFKASVSAFNVQRSTFNFDTLSPFLRLFSSCT